MYQAADFVKALDYLASQSKGDIHLMVSPGCQVAPRGIEPEWVALYSGEELLIKIYASGSGKEAKAPTLETLTLEW